MNYKQLTKDLICGLSLANLIFLGRWSELLGVHAGEAYSMRLPPRPVDFEAVMVNVCLLGVLLFLSVTAIRQWFRGRAILEWSLGLLLVLPLNALRIVVATPFPSLGGNVMRESWTWNVVMLAILLSGLLMLIVAPARRRLVKVTSVTLMLVSPLVLITFARAASQLVRYNPVAYVDRKLAPPIATSLPARRVLWIIFDEMDEKLTFANRRPGLNLPELDRFRNESFYATQAYSPARHTLESMPSLLTGKSVRTAKAFGPADLLLQFERGGEGRFRNEPNVFSRAREAGFDTALAGWYHPYCRELNDSLTGCEWSEFDFSPQSNSSGERLPEVILNQARSLLETTVLSPFGPSLTSRHHVRIYKDVLAAGMAFAADPRLGMVMVHFPVPHHPFIYDARSGRLDRRNSVAGGYEDALLLADHTLGQLRRSMEAAVVWDRTAILISSDHGLRFSEVDRGKSDRWVPFLLHLPRQHEWLRYEQPIQTVLSADLLLQILEGHLQTADSISGWLDQFRDRKEDSTVVNKQPDRRRPPVN